jgi:hypothetical protein
MSRSGFDKTILVKLLESRILATTVVGGFVLTNLSLVRAPSEPETLMLHYPLIGFTTLTIALGLQSVFTLCMLLVFGALDLATLHWLAFNKPNWAISAYRFNSIFSPLPFVLGGGNVLVFSILRALPIDISQNILMRSTNPLIMLSLSGLITGAIFVEGSIKSPREIAPLTLIVLIYVAYIIAIVTTP